MTDEEAIKQARIKIKGQCDDFKGHCCEGCSFLIGFISGLVVAIFVTFLQYSIWTNWAVKNGYAYYNSTTGYLVYK